MRALTTAQARGEFHKNQSQKHQSDSSALNRSFGKIRHYHKGAFLFLITIKMFLHKKGFVGIFTFIRLK
jgi:hypothetical protein